MTQINIGFIPLTDSAPLVVAQEQGFFEKEGLDVRLQREVSWSNIRDKLTFGEIEAAQMLAPMLMASTLGVGGLKKPLVTAYSFGLNGNAISVSNALYREMLPYEDKVLAKPELSAQVLKKVIDARKEAGKESLRFAVVFPFSMHHYLLRHWLSSAGISPEQDVQIVVVPPPSVVKAMEEDLIDGYCVGEPWGTHAAMRKAGVTLITGYEIWNNAPEKVLGVTKTWAEANPETHRKLIWALYQASEWIDQPDNKETLVHWLAQPQYVGAPESSLWNCINQEIYHPDDQLRRQVPNFTTPFKYLANFPWQSHADWILQQMQACGQLAEPLDVAAVSESIYWTDLYRDVVGGHGVTLPSVNRKPEGEHCAPWLLEGIQMGEDCFI